MLQDRRSELLHRAEVLIRTQGCSGFGSADLAAAADIRKSSIHHHLRSQEDLGVAHVQAYYARHDKALAAIRTRAHWEELAKTPGVAVAPNAGVALVYSARALAAFDATAT